MTASEATSKRRPTPEAQAKAVAKFAKANPSMTPARIARGMGGGVTSKRVSEILGEAEVFRRVQARFDVPPAPEYDEKACIEALRQVAFDLATPVDDSHEGEKWVERDQDGNLVRLGTVSLNAYVASGLAPDPRTFETRFGTWSKACQAAGVPHGTPIRRTPYEKRWSDEELRGIVRDFFVEVGPLGSMSSYERWRLTRSGMPSVASLRSRFGSWNRVKDVARDLVDSQ